MDPTMLIPLAERWAPYVVLALVLTTLAVRLLLPLARAVETWAIATPVAWDDGPAKRMVEILEWLAGVSVLLLSPLSRIAIGGLGAGRELTAAERPIAHRDVKPGNNPENKPGGEK